MKTIFIQYSMDIVVFLNKKIEPKNNNIKEKWFYRRGRNNRKESEKMFKMIQNDLSRYKELHNMNFRSESSENELRALITKITENSNIIENLALNTAKAKLADAYHLSNYDDVK